MKTPSKVLCCVFLAVFLLLLLLLLSATYYNRNLMIVTLVHQEVHKSLLPTGAPFLTDTFTVSLNFVPFFYKAFQDG